MDTNNPISKYECDIIIDALNSIPEKDRSHLFMRYICALTEQDRDDFSPLIERLGPPGPFTKLTPEQRDVKSDYILSLCGGDRVFMMFMII